MYTISDASTGWVSYNLWMYSSVPYNVLFAIHSKDNAVVWEIASHQGGLGTHLAGQALLWLVFLHILQFSLSQFHQEWVNKIIVVSVVVGFSHLEKNTEQLYIDVGMFFKKINIIMYFRCHFQKVLEA